MSSSRLHAAAAFTLLELVTAIVVLAILAVMIMGAAGIIRNRAEKVQCIANMRNLYAGASSYVTDQGHWPQVPVKTMRGQGSKDYAKAWIAALKPYGVSQSSWLCPTQQRLLHYPDQTKADNIRVDYNATPFDAQPRTPYKWARQPWFVEHAVAHEGGPLLIFTDGRVMSMQEFLQQR